MTSLRRRRERGAISEAWAEHERGEGLSTEQLRRDLGLA